MQKHRPVFFRSNSRTSNRDNGFEHFFNRTGSRTHLRTDFRVRHRVIRMSDRFQGSNIRKLNQDNDSDESVTLFDPSGGETPRISSTFSRLRIITVLVSLPNRFESVFLPLG